MDNELQFKQMWKVQQDRVGKQNSAFNSVKERVFREQKEHIGEIHLSQEEIGQYKFMLGEQNEK